MKNQFFTTVMLDKPRRIRYSNRALCRHQTLDKPLALSELSKPKRNFATLCQWLWACQTEDDALESPEALADVIDREKIGELIEALVDAITAETKPKNAEGSTPSPSPASS
jgi:hypothetical protein